jgi:4-nitrophenyl phosphatase
MNLGAVTTLIFDLDGVVWRGNSPIEGAVEAISQLEAAGKRCLYCTNNSSQTPAAFVEKLKNLGIEADEDDIITSSTATALYLSAQYTGPFLAYVVGGEGIQAAIQKIGARIVYDRDIEDDTKVDCVVAGIDRSFTYDKLNTAQRLIRSGALFVATNRDSTYPVEHGVVPGAGSIVAAIEAASGATPVTIGKPRPVMIQLVQQKFKLQPNEIAFIGDRLDTDIVCARRAGVAALLVLTGVTTLQQARRAKGELRPDSVFPDLASLVGVVLDNSPVPPLEMSELPSYEGEKALAEPVTQGAPRGEAESLPLAEEPIATEPATKDVAVATQNRAAFSFAGDAAEQGGTANTAAAEAPDAEAPGTSPTGGATPEWDDTWFAEDKDSVTEEAPTGEAQNEPATAAEEQSEPQAQNEDATPATASTSSSGFDWKLD